MDNTNQTGININKFISDTGMCSRREAEKYIVDERVTINNNVAKLGNRVNPGDVVKVDGEKLKTVANDIYIVFNKPVGIICTTELKIKNNTKYTIFYDDVNYIKNGWINRNRIIINKEVNYLTLSLEGASSNKKINEVGIGKTDKLLKTIELSYKKHPYFLEVFPIISGILNYIYLSWHCSEF